VFVQATTSTRKGKTYVTYLVRESFRTPQGPRSRTVCNITELPAATRELIAATLRGEPCARFEALQIASALDSGGLTVLREASERFGLDELLSEIDQPHRGRIKAMIFARLLFPSAKLALAEQARGTLLAQACELPAGELFDEDDLYLAMDELWGRWSGLQKGLFARSHPQGVRLVLYDLTSVYFEGRGPKGLSRYGYSRDHRGDRPQVVLAVATDERGAPLHLSVLRGNRADTKTLQGLLKILHRRLGIREATFVFDGGMSSQINLQALEKSGLNFVTRLSGATLRKLVEDLPEDKQLELGDEGRVMDFEHEGKRYVLAGGVWRAQRDRERREARVAKGRAVLEKLAGVQRRKTDAQKLASQAGRALERVKAHKYFTYRVNEAGVLEFSLKEQEIAEEQARDGWYVLHTNLKAPECAAEEVQSHYKGLLEIEEAFCEVKSHLEVRPVYHWKPRRVATHIRLCFLAYWLSARLAAEWSALGNTTEVPTLLRRLQTIRVGVLKAGQQLTRTLLVEIPPDLKPLLQRLRLTKLFARPPAWVTV
jgi:transposase